MSSHHPSSALEKKLQSALQKRHQSSTLRSLTIANNHIDFSSNDFLSLTASPLLKSAFLDELASSSCPLGSGGSRLLDGNSSYAETLERDISHFHRAESGLLFNSGFDANSGFFACVPQKGDVVVYDELIHASVHDGMRLSRASSTVSFKHNDVEDLRRVLDVLVGDGKMEDKQVFIAVEAVYSMDGDVAPLTSIVRTVEEVVGTQRGYLVVDEAHATGVIGEEGRGLVCELGLEKRVFARLHTFGKALGCNGGEGFFLHVLLGDRELTRSSHHTRIESVTPVSDQLRTPTDLHDIHVLPVPCCYTHILRVSQARQDCSTSSQFTVPHTDAICRAKISEDTSI